MGKVFGAKTSQLPYLEISREEMKVIAGPDFEENELSFLGVQLFIEGTAKSILSDRSKTIVDNLFAKV